MRYRSIELQMLIYFRQHNSIVSVPLLAILGRCLLNTWSHAKHALVSESLNLNSAFLGSLFFCAGFGIRWKRMIFYVGVVYVL